MNESRYAEILAAATRSRILVVGDVMLDHFIWGRVTRMSPEAPVPVVDFVRESYMAGGAANVARNLTSLGARATIFGGTGRDMMAQKLAGLLRTDGVSVRGLVRSADRHTSTKVRIVAGQQQITRVDRESKESVGDTVTATILRRLETALDHAQAVIVADYGKGVVTQRLLDSLRRGCRRRGLWLSLDPKPVRALDLSGLSLLTPNRKEAFELTGLPDVTRRVDPMADSQLLRVAASLLKKFRPAVLLITLGELGMLLCIAGSLPVHIPTIAKQVFDVSGAGDTVIASFTLAMVGGATPAEAAILSNHAAGVVVGKVGTSTVNALELRESLRHHN